MYAAHSGRVGSWQVECSTTIIHPSGWQTQYYHMQTPMVKPEDEVEVGQPIGRYASNLKTAICVGGGATNPHVHFTLRGPNGKAESLDGWFIGGYKIHAGAKPYDWNCSRCYFEKSGQTYCPWNMVPNISKLFEISLNNQFCSCSFMLCSKLKKNV